MPLISVVIPIYNGEKTIQQTVESVLKQTFLDFEIIAINDGSQDSTLEILQNIEDPRLKIFSYPNAGLSVSRNRGFSHSSGKFIAFLDADDLWTPDKLEAQLKALHEYPQAAVAYSWTELINEHSQSLGLASSATLNGDVYANLLRANFLTNGSNPLIHRQALTEVGLFDESLNAAEDWDMYLRLAQRYHFVAVPSAQILYRKSTYSMSANIPKMEAACLKVIERAYQQAPPSLQHLKKESLGFLYKDLISRAFQGTPQRQKALKAANLFWRYLRKDPACHRLVRLKLLLFYKIFASLIRPYYPLTNDS